MSAIIETNIISDTIVLSQIDKTVHFKNCLGVFQGGGCKALAFVGAYGEAKSRGVNFSEVAGTSAGSIFAALIAAGATPQYMENLINDIDFNRFNHPIDKNLSNKYGFNKYKYSRKIAGRVFKKNKIISNILNFVDNIGLFSSEELELWLNDELKTLLNIENKTVTFKDLKIPLHVIATDLIKKKQKIWNENTPDISVAYAVRCSCSIPLYFQPVNMEFVDGGLVSNLPSFSLNNGVGHFEKILCFTLSSKPEEIKCIKTYLESIAGSVVDGAIQIQETLQYNTYNIKINDLPVTTTGFELLTPELIQDTISIGKRAAAEFFNDETTKISEKEDISTPKLTKDYILNSVVMEDVDCHNHIYMCFNDTKHIYGLFPTILSWLVEKKIRITFITRYIKNITTDHDSVLHEKYRRKLIERFGIHLIERESIPFDAFIFEGDYKYNDKAIFLYDKDDLEFNIGHGAIYDGKYNLHIISSLIKMLKLTDEDKKNHDLIISNLKNFTIEKCSSKQHIRKLKNVQQYKGKNVSIKKIKLNLSNVKLMTKYVKSYKYNQIDKLYEILNKNGISLFDYSVITFSDGLQFLITPIIVEKHGNDYIVIKGNSRLNYAYRELELNGYFSAVVANKVSMNLPSIGCYPTSDCIITTINKEGSTRYENWSYRNFRRVEETIRNPSDFLDEEI